MSDPKLFESDPMAKNHRTELLEFMHDMWAPPGHRTRSSPAQFEKVVARIRDAGKDELIVRLFKDLGASYRNPWVWYALMGRFAETLYLTDRGGRPAKHKRPAAAVLRRDYIAVAKQFDKPRSKTVCFEMAKRHPKYSTVPLATLATWVSKAGAVQAFKMRKAKTSARR